MKKIYLALVALVLLCACAEKPTTTATETTPTSWQEIKPEEIDVNAIKMFNEEWKILSAGNDSLLNMMTISWGTLGELWGRPVVTVYVSPSRYTYKFMEENDFFTLTSFPEEYREKLQYLGSASGRNEDKLKGSGFTLELTPRGNPIYKEANLAIECRKIYRQQLDKSQMPVEQQKWYDEGGPEVHVMYVGEIVGVWKK